MLPGSIGLIGMLPESWKIHDRVFDIYFARRPYLEIDQSLLIEQNGLFLLRSAVDTSSSRELLLACDISLLHASLSPIMFWC